MTQVVQRIAADEALLSSETVQEALAEGLGGRFAGQRVLVLIPDHTRTVPLPALFRQVVAVLADTRQLDFMVALGTHPPLEPEAMRNLVGITAEEQAGALRHIGLLNHEWNRDDSLVTIGTLTGDMIRALAGDTWHPSLGGDVPIRINRRLFDYDHVLILGPVFPHEVVGFSGGAKYLFPGVSGPDMINMTHWLGALATVLNTIGIKDTPVRAAIHQAAKCVTVPVTLAALVVQDAGLAGIFIGDHERAWSAAADLSARRHIRYVDRPFQRVLAWAPSMYDELWTASKAMYKLDPVVADGGEIVVYAPHLSTVSRVHGAHIYEAGYHVRDYFLAQWERFKHLPLGVLAHGTHLRGSGTYSMGEEKARIKVSLASQISREDCEKLALGYVDPAQIDIESWKASQQDDVLFVPKAGEILHRVRGT